ncbi:MAG: DUF4381 domain-containing protein [Alphaproteobacteria bacterium]
MNNQVNPLLTQIKDIKGLNEVGIGWVLPAWSILVLCLVIAFAYWISRKSKASKNTQNIERGLTRLIEMQNENTENIKSQLSEISEILRLCALEYYGRKECAALQGEEWLSFLKARDANNFDWIRDASVLADFPYMPSEGVREREISHIIKASEKWVRNHV